MNKTQIKKSAKATKPRKVHRPGSGRTKGSFSFVRLTLGDLKKKFADDTTPITVGRVWAQNLGFNVETTTNANALYSEIAAASPAGKVEATVVNLDADEDAETSPTTTSTPAV